MQKVHLFMDHVTCNVYWIDTVYLQNNLSTEFRKGRFSYFKEKYIQEAALILCDWNKTSTCY